MTNKKNALEIEAQYVREKVFVGAEAWLAAKQKSGASHSMRQTGRQFTLC
ncbi:MAG TPA: hypothetical protein VF719_11690 [Abditibacteriaceae bacterium]